MSACLKCNRAYALDEEYCACLVECAFCGSTRPDDIERDVIRQILKKKPLLGKRLKCAHTVCGTDTYFAADEPRVSRVLLKLARGHVAYEQGQPLLGEPLDMHAMPLVSMTSEIRGRFEEPPALTVLPEVASRALQRAALSSTRVADWIVVQPGRYRYLTWVGDITLVRLVIREYLACEVRWA